jgi:predicted nucleic acid-binding protein
MLIAATARARDAVLVTANSAESEGSWGSAS